MINDLLLEDMVSRFSEMESVVRVFVRKALLYHKDLATPNKKTHYSFGLLLNRTLGKKERDKIMNVLNQLQDENKDIGIELITDTYSNKERLMEHSRKFENSDYTLVFNNGVEA
jgi:hypothetical protein